MALGLVPEPSARSVSGTIGEAGGAFATTGLDGTTYTFTVPAGALVGDRVLTMTPLAGVANLPLSGGLAAAVQFAPDDLAFLKPATLVVTLADARNSTGLVGFGFRRAGDDLGLALTEVSGRTLTFGVSHFSGIGAGYGTLDEIGALLSSVFAENLFTSQLAQLMAQGVHDPLEYQRVLKEWVRLSLRGTLTATFLEGGVNQSLLEYLGWKAAIMSVSRFLGVDVAPGLADEVAEMDHAMAHALFVVGFGGAQSRCFIVADFTGDPTADETGARARLSAANDALEWFRILNGLGLAQLALPDLNLDTALALLCVKVNPFDARIIPQEPAPGDTAELRVRAGLTFEKPAGLGLTTFSGPVFAPPVTVMTTASGIDAPIADGPTDATGIFSAMFRRAGSAPVTLGVQACIRLPDFPFLRAVCAGGIIATATTTTTTTSSTSTSVIGSTSTTIPGLGFLITTRTGVIEAGAQAATTPLDFTDGGGDDIRLSPSGVGPFTLTGGPARSASATSAIGDAMGQGMASGTVSLAIDPATKVLTVIVDGSGSGAASLVVHDFVNDGSMGAGGSGTAEVVVEFTVTGAPLHFSAQGSLTGSMASVRLGLLSDSTPSVINLVGQPVSVSGTLVAGTYHYVADFQGAAGLAGNNVDPNGTGMLSAMDSGAASVTFTLGP